MQMSSREHDQTCIDSKPNDEDKSSGREYRATVVIAVPSWLCSTLASDAMDGQGALPVWILPMVPGRRIAGWVCTASITENDNLGLRQAIAGGPIDGTVLVAIGSPTGTRAIIGDILATWMLARGFEALVTDGLVRDSAQLRQMDLGIWCRGVTPVASTRKGPGTVGISVRCGEVNVSPGDLLVADDDGVVVSPAHVPALLRLAEQRLHRDEAMKEQIRRGLAPD